MYDNANQNRYDQNHASRGFKKFLYPVHFAVLPPIEKLLSAHLPV